MTTIPIINNDKNNKYGKKINMNVFVLASKVPQSRVIRSNE